MKRILFALLFLLCAVPAWAAPTIVLQGGNPFKCAAGDGAVASVTIDATGGNFIVVGLAYATDGGFTSAILDGTNAYTGLTEAPGTTAWAPSRIFYAKNVNSGSLTISSTSHAGTGPSICAMVWAGMNSSAPFDVEAAGTTTESTTTTMKPGSLTTTHASDIFITVENGGSTMIPTIDNSVINAASGFSAVVISPFSYSIVMGYKILTVTSTLDVTWTVEATTSRGAVAASFKAADSSCKSAGLLLGVGGC